MACRVCAKDATQHFELNADVHNQNVPANAQVRVSGWGLNAVDAAADLVELSVNIATLDGTGGILEHSENGATALNCQYQEVDGLLATSLEGGVRVLLAFVSAPPTNPTDAGARCFIIDEASLTYGP